MRMQQAQATHQKEMKQLESDLTKHANQQLEALQKKMDEAVNNAQSSMGSEIQKKDQEIATLKASIETLQAKVSNDKSDASSKPEDFLSFKISLLILFLARRSEKSSASTATSQKIHRSCATRIRSENAREERKTRKARIRRSRWRHASRT